MSKTPETLALKLWVDWFEKRGSPKTYGVHGTTCFFCDNVVDTGGKIRHRPDCTYRQAKKLVNEIRTLNNEQPK